MMLGNSGATIETHVVSESGKSFVRKTGGDTDLHKQVAICRYLEHVCPRILRTGDTWYEMEYLTHPPIGEHPHTTMLHIVKQLMSYVWSRAPLLSSDPSWRFELDFQLRNVAPWITTETLNKAYGTEYDRKPFPYIMTHGDPTLANAMYRDDGSLVLIDPLPTRPATPSLREVDVGKLLQSLSGWEGVKSGRDPSRMNMDPAHVVGTCLPFNIRGLDVSQWSARCYLWAAIHCARVVRHGHPTTQMKFWSELESRRWNKECERALGI